MKTNEEKVALHDFLRERACSWFLEESAKGTARLIMTGIELILSNLSGQKR